MIIDTTNMEELEKAFNTFVPDLIIHLSIAVDQNRKHLKEPGIKQTVNIVALAKTKDVPVIYMSSESVYGGRETVGDYKEDDSYHPRSIYAEAKTESEKIIRNAGLPYLILRWHRFVGVLPDYNRKKQFPDHLKSILRGTKIELDNKKLFKPTYTNHVCDVMHHYMTKDLGKKMLLNIWVDKPTTYYQFMKDLLDETQKEGRQVMPTGEEKWRPENSTLNLEKLNATWYPTLSYNDLLKKLAKDINTYL